MSFELDRNRASFCPFFITVRTFSTLTDDYLKWDGLLCLLFVVAHSGLVWCVSG